MPPTSETRVWLLRHGASTFNVQHRCQGGCDEPELTQQGRDEARLSGEPLVSQGIQAVITSPLRRAAETAEELLKWLPEQDRKIMFWTDARLREIELYNWEGMPLEEIRRRFPEQYGDWRLRPTEFRMKLDSGEVQYPVCNLYDRVRSFWSDLLTTYAGRSILLVSHGGTIRALVASALGLGSDHFHSFQQSNCGLSRLRFAPQSGQAKLDLLNGTAHLGERLPKPKEGLHGVRLLLISVSDVNTEAVRRLAAFFEDIVIAKTLIADAAAHNMASQIFTSGLDSCSTISEATADTVVDQVLQENSEGQLRHVAMLGPEAIVLSILRQQLHISEAAAESLELRPLEITSVHFPGSGVPPILQALNMPKPSPALVGG